MATHRLRLNLFWYIGILAMKSIPYIGYLNLNFDRNPYLTSRKGARDQHRTTSTTLTLLVDYASAMAMCIVHEEHMDRK